MGNENLAGANGATNRRIARVSRHMAKLVCQLRREGDDEGARKLEAAAIETVEAMRGGVL